MATATDNFDRADTGTNGGLGSNWTCYTATVESNTAFEILSNKARITTSSTNRFAKYNAISPGGDQYSQATWNLVSGNDQSLTVRMTDGDNNYHGGPNSSTQVRIAKFVGGVFGSIATAAYTVQNGDVFKLVASGTALKLYVNGSLKIDTTDGDISSGSPGIGAYRTIDWDDWSGGDGDGTSASSNGRLMLLGVG